MASTTFDYDMGKDEWINYLMLCCCSLKALGLGNGQKRMEVVYLGNNLTTSAREKNKSTNGPDLPNRLEPTTEPSIRALG
jgi:hypothetical protein